MENAKNNAHDNGRTDFNLIDMKRLEIDITN